MAPSAPAARGGGARRVLHPGNVVLSLTVLLVTLVLSNIALDPRRSGTLLSARHSTPPLDHVEGSLFAGFTPVAVQVKAQTVLVVPAVGVHGVMDVSRALDQFFSVGLGSPADYSNDTAVNRDKRAETSDTPSPAAVTVADVYSAVLLRPASAAAAAGEDGKAAAEAAPASRRRPSVLHLCSALTCVSPYLAQEWSDRAAAAAPLVRDRHANGTHAASRVPAAPVTNFALVYGQTSEALAVMQELAEQRVLTASPSLALEADDPAMPVVGELPISDLEASCGERKQCAYVSPATHTHLATLLEAQAASLPTDGARRRVFEEWRRRNASRSDSAAWADVEVLPASSVVFADAYTLHTFPLDLVHVDVGSGDSVATLAYLVSLASVAATPVDLRPRNVLVSFYPSEWVRAIVAALLRLETAQHYNTVPLHNACLGHEAVHSPRSRWSMSHMQSWMDSASLEGTYVSPLLARGRAAQTPLCTVLLSQQVATLDELLRLAWKETRVAPPTATPVERFLYHSLGLSPEDERLLLPLPDDGASGTYAAASKGPVSGGIGRIAGSLLQYIYFVVPLGVGVVLIRSVCRRRATR
ncbi:hypothetical protein NESM_000237800 [Novymonas esmeraldas]|uniref:Uncharacterized protein n=1 Tax=Novymonas esmeraldas TaxID=1808958 RepID=A0AAW0F7R7_9TRYP